MLSTKTTNLQAASQVEVDGEENTCIVDLSAMNGDDYVYPACEYTLKVIVSIESPDLLCASGL